MNTVTNDKIELGSDVCPLCNSDSWKSAKMVVMEGTTNTTGTIDGTVTDPGKFSGGLRNFLLSDRWFSWDYPIEAEIGLTSSTGLVEEVKRLMVSHAAEVEMPLPPVAPKKIGMFEKDANAPEKPTPPSTPRKPEKPTAKSMSKTFLKNIMIFFISLIIIGNLFTINSLFLILIFCVGGILVAFFSYDKTLKMDEYNAILKGYPMALKSYEQANEKYEKDINLYKTKCEEFSCFKKREEEQAEARYKKQLSEYEAEKLNVMKIRELLWNRARICTRCGTAYLSSG